MFIGCGIHATRDLFPLLSQIHAISLDPTHVGWYRKKEVIDLLYKFELEPVFIPTSISLNPATIASRFSLPSNNLISQFEDQFYSNEVLILDK